MAAGTPRTTRPLREQPTASPCTLRRRRFRLWSLPVCFNVNLRDGPCSINIRGIFSMTVNPSASSIAPSERAPDRTRPGCRLPACFPQSTITLTLSTWPQPFLMATYLLQHPEHLGAVRGDQRSWGHSVSGSAWGFVHHNSLPNPRVAVVRRSKAVVLGGRVAVELADVTCAGRLLPPSHHCWNHGVHLLQWGSGPTSAASDTHTHLASCHRCHRCRHRHAHEQLSQLPGDETARRPQAYLTIGLKHNTGGGRSRPAKSSSSSSLSPSSTPTLVFPHCQLLHSEALQRLHQLQLSTGVSQSSGCT